MFGKEGGSTKWENIKKVNKELSNQNDSIKDFKNIVVSKRKWYGKSYNQIVNTRNRMISQNIQMTLDTEITDLNNNILIAGGSGAGKSFRWAKPNLMQMTGSYVVTDPKGELLRSSAGFLKRHGYCIKVINLLGNTGMKKSSHYNPFRYIRSDLDIQKLCTNLIANTTPKGTTPNDPFWEKAEAMFLQFLFYYVKYEMPEAKRNFRSVLELMNKCDFEVDNRGNKIDTEVDYIMNDLEQREPNHPAVLAYNKSMKGAADTVRCVLMTANSRLQPLENNTVLSFLDEDEMDIMSFGERKTAVFCVIPDNDKTFNFLVGMFYTQLFQELYHQADFVHGGALPVHLTCLFDEFANVALPDDYLSLLSTMRSRNISSVIIVQNMAQLKSLFKDEWESLPGNCDTFIYLGGNEKETHKYISEMIGKTTIDKRTTGETKGKQGSASRNYDTQGRELMMPEMPEEVRKLNKKDCIVFIRGYNPIRDRKIDTLHHPLWKQLIKGERDFQFDGRKERIKEKEKRKASILSLEELKKEKKAYQMEVEEYECDKEFDSNVKKPKQVVFSLTYEDIMSIDETKLTPDTEPEQIFSKEAIEKNQRKLLEKLEEKKRLAQENRSETVKMAESVKDEKEAELFLRMVRVGYKEEQIQLLLEIYHQGVYEADKILELFSPEMDTALIQILKDKLLSA